MSATCNFCGQQFTNSQGVRAHLKACEAYRDRPAKAERQGALPRKPNLGSESLGTSSLGTDSPGSVTPDLETAFDPVRQMQQRLAAERLRLQLRELEEAHAELDRRAQAKERERTEAQDQAAAQARTTLTDQEEAVRRSIDATNKSECREAAERERHARRRAVIQEVKRQTIDSWFLRFLLASDLKARMLQAIERELAALPVEELPVTELVQIAEGVRDSLHREAKQIETEAKRQDGARLRMIQHGVDFARRELDEADELDFSERMHIEARIKRELESLEGDETVEDIEDLVADLIEDEGVLWDEGGE